jgi:uncharacterized protein with HEPN domain
MTRQDDTARLRHMLDHAAEAIEMVKGREREDLDRDRQLNLALVRLLEIVGEAAARVSAGTQQRLAHIPWPEVVGLRNRLIHGYDEVDFDILWDVIQVDLPPLVAELRKAVEGGAAPRW